MQRSSKTLCRKILTHRPTQNLPISRPNCDVFINHRSIDTKRTISGLLFDHLSRLNLRPFLDSKNMKPGDKLFEKIDEAIRDSKLAIAVFSPRYCDSFFCLHELSLILESNKKIIPIFCDVKPSELRVMGKGMCHTWDVQRFSRALEEAKFTVGLTFDSSTGDWSEFLRSASDAVFKNLVETENDWTEKMLYSLCQYKGY